MHCVYGCRISKLKHQYRESSIRQQRSGFTLVELSIVLVILGLLVGGVLTGQSLIRASELRAVTTEQQRYATALNAFRDKYFAIPGDMANAVSFWGTATSNGSGDGTVSYGAGAASTTGEMFQFWNMLSLAGLIEGTYTGLSGTSSASHIIGSNCPKSKLQNGGWSSYTLGIWPGDAASYVGDYGSMMGFGAARTGSWPYKGVLTPEEAWNIDTKMDDGKPGTGKVFARDYVGFAAAAATKCTTSVSSTDFAGDYNLGNTPVSCAFHFLKVY